MKKNKFLYLHILQGNYGYGWEDLTAEDTYKEAREQLKCYRENEGGNYRIIQRREINIEGTLKGVLQHVLDLPESSFDTHESDLYVLYSKELATYLTTRPDLKPTLEQSDVVGQDWHGKQFYNFHFQNRVTK